eukprot:Platyproteum_vivax@DN16609_c0_g1_i1.p1
MSNKRPAEAMAKASPPGDRLKPAPVNDPQKKQQQERELNDSLMKILNWSENRLSLLHQSVCPLIKEGLSWGPEKRKDDFLKIEKSIFNLQRKHLEHLRILETLKIEDEAYGQLSSQTDEQVEKEAAELGQLKEELGVALKKRKRLLEFERISNDISSLPDKSSSQKGIEDLKQKLVVVSKEVAAANDKTVERNRQAELLLHVFADLRSHVLDSTPVVAKTKVANKPTRTTSSAKTVQRNVAKTIK